MVREAKKNNLYAKIVAFFFILTLVAIFLVIQIALARVTIKLESQSKEKSANVLVQLKPENTIDISSDTILGKIISLEFELEAETGSSQEEVPSQYAAGYVTIYNNYSRPQILVGNTRLLTPDNKLFRIAQRVEIPIGGQVEVWVQADEPGQEYISGPTTLTIPGLWEGLQSFIYAESLDGLTMQSIPKYTVSQENLDLLTEQIKTQAEKQALEKINELLPANLKVSPDRLAISYHTTSGSQLGQETPRATLKQKVIAHGLVFDQEDLIKAAKEKFQNELQGSETLLNFNEQKISYRVLEMDKDKNEAILDVTVSGLVSSQAGQLAIDKEKIVGRSQEEISQYLESVGIERFQLYFFPRWLSTAPKFPDHIIIK